LADLGKAVLVSSHILPELADVCDTVGILKSGKLIACGPVQSILRTVRQRRLVEVGVLGSADPVRRLLKSAPGDWNEVALDAKANFGVTSQNGHATETIRFEVTADEQQLVQTLNMLVSQGIQVTNYYEVPADLEDVFMTLTR
jgi:ABC-2 type transport system ATP-binding protein